MLREVIRVRGSACGSVGASLLSLSQIAPYHDQSALNQIALLAPAQVMPPTGSIRMLIITGSIETSTQVRFDCCFDSIVARNLPQVRNLPQLLFDCWFDSIVAPTPVCYVFTCAI